MVKFLRKGNETYINPARIFFLCAFGDGATSIYHSGNEDDFVLVDGTPAEVAEKIKRATN